MKLRRVFLLLASLVTGTRMAACGSGGDVGLGGTCFLVTDCKEGLFCLRAEGSDNGTCSGKGGLVGIEPTSDAGLDGNETGTEPMSDADGVSNEADTTPDSAKSPDAQRDSETADHTAPPEDTGAPPVDSGAQETPPSDAGVADTASATGG